MKPRLRKWAGVWNCWTPITKTGLGYTPKQAYDDWLLLALGVK